MVLDHDAQELLEARPCSISNEGVPDPLNVKLANNLIRISIDSTNRQVLS